MKDARLSLAIQAGGMSQRMGQDKASLMFCGRPLLQWVIERVQVIANETLVISNCPEKFSFLDCPAYPDEIPGSGPLGGLYTALLHSKYPSVGVLACDMPFCSPGLFVHAHGVLMDSGADVVIPKTTKGLEPFHAVYRKETCLPLVWNALQAGQKRMVDWFATANVQYLKPDETLLHDSQQLAFFNINTPDDLQRAEALTIPAGFGWVK